MKRYALNAAGKAAIAAFVERFGSPERTAESYWPDAETSAPDIDKGLDAVVEMPREFSSDGLQHDLVLKAEHFDVSQN